MLKIHDIRQLLNDLAALLKMSILSLVVIRNSSSNIAIAFWTREEDIQ